MMKFVALVLSLFIFAMSSQANTNVKVAHYGTHKLSELKTRTQTKSVLVYAVPKAQRKLLDADDNNDGPPGPDELDLQTYYSRNRLPQRDQDLEDEELSDYVTIRLAIARAKAMAKYREIWT